MAAILLKALFKDISITDSVALQLLLPYCFTMINNEMK